MATSPVNFSMLDPSMAADQMALERNMALAQALRQQSMTPIDTNGRMAGAVMSRVSPFEGLAKMLQGYSAGAWNEQNDADRQALAQKQSALIGALIGGQTNPQAASTAALGAGAAQGDVGPTVTNAARMDQSVAGQGAGGIPSLTGDPSRDRALAMTMGLDEYAKAAAKRYEPTDFQRDLRLLPTGEQGIAARNKFLPPVAADKAMMIPDGKGGYRLDPTSMGAVQQVEQMKQTYGAPIKVPLNGKSIDVSPAEWATFQQTGQLPARFANMQQFANAPQLRNAQGLGPNQADSDLIRADAARNGIANPQIGKWDPTPAVGQIAPSPQLGVTRSPEDTKRAEAQVDVETKPVIEAATTGAKALTDYGTGLSSRLAESQELLKRITESRDALTRFQAGGGAEVRSQLAQYAQAVGMSQGMVDKIAGGDLSAVQEFQKYAAQEALQTMRQALASDDGKSSPGNKIAMQMFFKNNPNIDTDPRAIEKIFNFQTKLHNQMLAQHDALDAFIGDPKTRKDVTAFENYWAHRQVNSGNVQARQTQGEAKGTTKPQASGPTSVTTDAEYNALPSGATFIGPDGKHRRKP